MKPRCLSHLSASRKLWIGTAAATALAGPIHAANINWSGTSGDLQWATPTNWVGDLLPGPADIAVMSLNQAQTISLGGTSQEIGGISFTQTSAYNLTNGSLVLGQFTQTGNVNNQIASSVTITTANAGADILNANITSNTLQLQGKITSGGLTKTGNGLLRLGTSGTNFENAINGPINLNGGTLQAAAGSTAGVNNPLGGTDIDSDLINIGASGVTLQLTAQTSYDFGRQVVANNNNFTLRGDPATGDPGDFRMTIGRISIGNATLTATTGSGYQLATSELALNTGSTTTVVANNFLYLNSISGDSTTKIVKNGGSDLRIAGNGTNATTFAGDIDHNQGWLVLESNGATAQPFGNAATKITITHATNNPVVSLRAEASRTFDGVNIDAGNNNFQLDVRNLTGATNGFTMSAGAVTMGNATLNVIGDRAQARLSSFTIDPGATLTTINTGAFSNAAQHLRVDVLTGDANATLRKNGGQALFVGASDSTFDGKLELNGGTLVVEGATGLNPIQDLAGPITFTNGSTLSLRANASLDFGDNVDVAFTPAVLSSTIEVRRSNGSLTGQVIGLGDVSITGTGNRTLTLNSGESYTATFDALNVGAGTVARFVGNASVTTGVLSIPADASLEKFGGGTLTLTSDNSATLLGTLTLRAGTITATTAGALSNGGVVVGNPTPNSAGYLADFSRLNYNAVDASGAAGLDAIAVAGGVVDLNVTPGAGESFAVQADGRIQGTSTQLAELTVGTNLTLAAGAIVSHESPGAGTVTVQGLTPDMGLYYGIANTANSLPLVGAGTPWKGITGDNAARTVNGSSAGNSAVLSVNGGDNNPATIEASIGAMSDQTLALGSSSTTDGQFQWATTAANGEKITVAITGNLGVTSLGLARGGRVAFYEPAATSNIASTVDKVVIEGSSLILAAAETLGGVPVEVRAGGSLDIISAATNLIDANVNVKAGGVLFLNDNQTLHGSGTIVIEAGGKLDITGAAPANILTGSETNGQPITFTGTGHTVRFSAENVEELDTRIPDAGSGFVIAGGNATTVNGFGSSNINGLSVNAQTAGLSTDGGFITNDTTSRGLNAPLTIGPGGATIAATRNTSLILGTPVSTTGAIQIGSNTAIDGRDKSFNFSATNSLGQPDPYNGGTTQVIFGSDFSAASVVVQNSNAAFMSGNTTITGTLTATGGVLYLDGGGPTGGTQGQLTDTLEAGTLAAGGISLGQYNRTEMKLNLPSDGSRTDINQAFTIEGAVNPQDNRRFWVSRSSGTATGVNFNDITLKAGAELAFDEDSTDVRAAIKLAGNANTFTGAHDVMDFLSITRDASLPAYDGTNPVILTHGKVNVAGAQGFNTGTSSVFGEIADGVEVNLVRGTLQLVPGSTLNGVVRTQTAPAGGDALVISSSNNGSNTFNTATTIGGTGRVELGFSAASNGPEDFEIRGTEVTNATAGQAPLHTHSGEIRVVNDGINTNLDGVVRANRVNDSDRTARVQVDNIRVAAGAGIQFASANGIPLTVETVTLDGSGTIDTTGVVTINNLNTTPSSVLSFTGPLAPTVVGPVSADTIHVSNARFNSTVSATTVVNVAGGSATFGQNVASTLKITGGTANFSPGAGNTSTVSGAVVLDDGGLVAVGNGMLDLGSQTITSTSSGTLHVAGLREGLLPGSFNITDANTSPTVRLGPVMAGTAAGWPTNSTFVYSGEILIPDNGVAEDGFGSVAFGESFDDSVRVDIDGIQRLSNGTWNDSTGTGEIMLAAGWHQVEFRFGQGTGGVGPVAQDGWNGQLGFGIDLTPGFDAASPTSAPVQSEYVAPLDNGTMNLFRATVRNGIAVAANSRLQAGGFTNLGVVQFNGSNAQVALNEFASPTASSTAAIEVATGASATLTVEHADDSLTVGSLALNGPLALSGNGNFTVTGSSTGLGGVTKSGSGVLTVNGIIPGLTSVVGGSIRGSGALEGLFVDQGVVAPGDGVGILTLGSLTATGISTFAFEIGGGPVAGSATAGTSYDQINITGTTVNLGGAALELAMISPLQQDDVLTLILNSSFAPLQGTFAGYANGASFSLAEGYEVQISYFDDASTPAFELSGGDDVSLLVTLAVPEPGSALLLLSGLGAAFATRRRRNR